MLYDNPRQRCSLKTSVNSNDSGGGTETTYTVLQADIPCSINLLTSNQQLKFSQQNIAVTHCIGFKSSVLTTTPVPGLVAVNDRTGKIYQIVGIRSGEESQLGTIVPLTYLDCLELLG